MMMEHLNDLNDELKEIAPDFPVKNSTSAPEGYFLEFPDKVINRWRQEITVRKTLLPWKKWASLAATITVLLVVGAWLISGSLAPKNDQITALEAYQYIHENIDDFEGLIETENLSQEVHRLDVPQEEIEEYLLEELSDEDAEELF